MVVAYIDSSVCVKIIVQKNMFVSDIYGQH